MSAIPPIAPAGSSLPTEIDAFRQAMTSAGHALGADPNAIGRTLMNGIENFRTEEASFRSQAGVAIDGDSARVDLGEPSSQRSGGETPVGAGSDQGSSPREALQQTQARSVGLMMQTYSFALEATLVGNAATTFTNSVNTLMKTQ
jgi:hypothetical protein